MLTHFMRRGKKELSMKERSEDDLLLDPVGPGANPNPWPPSILTLRQGQGRKRRKKDVGMAGGSFCLSWCGGWEEGMARWGGIVAGGRLSNV